MRVCQSLPARKLRSRLLQDDFAVACKCGCEGVEHADAVLHARAQIRHGVQIVLCAFRRAEAAGYLCLGLTLQTSRSAWLLSKGTMNLRRNRHTASLSALSRSVRDRSFPFFLLPRRLSAGSGGSGQTASASLTMLSCSPLNFRIAVLAYLIPASGDCPFLRLLHGQ